MRQDGDGRNAGVTRSPSKQPKASLEAALTIGAACPRNVQRQVR